jgi:hypothetical protein
MELICPANLSQLSFWDQYKVKGQYCVGNLLGITKATLLATRLIFKTHAMDTPSPGNFQFAIVKNCMFCIPKLSA